MGTKQNKNIVNTGTTNRDSLQGMSMVSPEEENKILVESLRFYAERRNSEVGYFTFQGNQTLEIFEKDIDAGLNAKITLNLLGIPYEDRLPDGYLSIEKRKQEILQSQRKKTLEEKMLQPVPFYFMLFGTIFALITTISVNLLCGLIVFMFALILCVRNVLIEED